MKLIIPMSGLGSRFLAQGYKDPKPLIQVGGKPMIEWVLKMFPLVSDIYFICREEHIEHTNMQKILEGLAPQAHILSIKGDKKGPVYAVSQVADILDFDEDVIFSYCDYYMQWDMQRFVDFVECHKPDGAVPTYTGFHPHLLIPKNLYASCDVDAHFNLKEIREKYSFEKDKTRAHHSPGVYYFKSGHLAKKYFKKALEEDISLNGEYYISLVYNLLVREGLSVKVYPHVEKFCQWGTPEDLNEFVQWTKVLERQTKDNHL